jgi:hypothetical protein
MSQQTSNFVLWAIPRFHRTGAARVVTTTSHDSREGVFSSERRVREEDKAKAVTSTTGNSTPRRYAFS